MNKIVSIDTKFAWKISKTADGFKGDCVRLGLSVQAGSPQELVETASKVMHALFAEKQNNKSLNEYAYSHSIAYTTKDFEGSLLLTVPIVLED